jgi:hypothetical protein
VLFKAKYKSDPIKFAGLKCGVKEVHGNYDNGGHFRCAQHFWKAADGLFGKILLYTLAFAVPAFFKFVHDALGGHLKDQVSQAELYGYTHSGNARSARDTCYLKVQVTKEVEERRKKEEREKLPALLRQGEFEVNNYEHVYITTDKEEVDSLKEEDERLGRAKSFVLLDTSLKASGSAADNKKFKISFPNYLVVGEEEQEKGFIKTWNNACFCTVCRGEDSTRVCRYSDYKGEMNNYQMVGGMVDAVRYKFDCDNKPSNTKAFVKADGTQKMLRRVVFFQISPDHYGLGLVGNNDMVIPFRSASQTEKQIYSVGRKYVIDKVDYVGEVVGTETVRGTILYVSESSHQVKNLPVTIFIEHNTWTNLIAKAKEFSNQEVLDNRDSQQPSN